MNTKNIIIEKIELNGAEINEKGEIEDIDSIAVSYTHLTLPTN